MGTANGAAPTNNGSASSAGVEDDLSALGRGGRGNNRNTARSGGFMNMPRQFLKGLFGGGGTESAVATETNVQATAGEGASSGLPTCADDGSIEMVFHQVGSICNCTCH